MHIRGLGRIYVYQMAYKALSAALFIRILMMPPYCPLDCRCHGHLGSTNFIPSYNIPVNRTVPLVSSSPLEMSWFVRFGESQLGKC